MHALLAAALEPALRDLTSTCDASWRLDETEWNGPLSAWLWESTSGMGIFIERDASFEAQVASLADQIQEFAIEYLRSTSWPECLLHPGTHPMDAAVFETRAVWCCPKSHEVLADVGAL